MKRLSAYTLLLFVSFFSLKIEAQNQKNANARIRKIISDTALQHAIVSFVARDLSTDSTIININGNKCLVPASIQKIITTGTALERLDSIFTFKTQVGYRGVIDERGVLHGDLVIIGSGDPSLGSMYFNKVKTKQKFLSDWAQSVKKYGITKIDGGIKIDISHYEDWPLVGTWTYEDLGNYYGAGIYGITMLDNICELHFYSPATIGGKTIFKYAVPQIPNLQLDNQVVAGKGGDNAYVFQTPTSDKMIVRGDITAGKSDFIVKACISNPPVMLADMLRKSLDSLGITQTVTPQIIMQSTRHSEQYEFCDIYTQESVPLPQIIQATNQNSVNLFAEHLLKEIGSCMKGNGSTQDGLVSLYEFCKSKKIDFGGVQLVDGSGLSRFNLITANFMVDFLTYYFKRSPYFPLFYKSLPIAGKDGTLETFGKKSAIEGKVIAKTGSMTRVKNLAGYLTTKSGKTIAFTFMANNYDCGGIKIKGFQEDILKVIYELY